MGEKEKQPKEKCQCDSKSNELLLIGSKVENGTEYRVRILPLQFAPNFLLLSGRRDGGY